MSWYQNSYVWWLFLSTIASALLALFAWTQRARSGVRAFFLLVMATGVWAFAYALELAAPTLPLKLIFAKLQYLGIAPLPSLVFFFVITYLQRDDDWLTMGLRRALIALPLVWNAFVWTNEYHRLNWTATRLITVSGVTIVDFDHGPIFWAGAGYSYILLALAVVLLFREVRRGRYLYRRQSLVLLVGVLLPWLGNLAYLVGLTPLPHLDLTPFVYVLSNVVLAWGLFRQHLLDVVPIARDVVVESMEDAVIVLDAQRHVVDLNAAARRLLAGEREAGSLLGCPVAEVFAGHETLLQHLQDGADVTHRVVWEDEEETEYFDLRVSPLFNRRGAPRGQVLVLRDVTAQVLVEKALRESETHLRTQNARLRKLSQAVEQSASSVVITDLDGRVEYVNPKFEELTGYTKEEVLGQPLHVLRSGTHPPDYYTALWDTLMEGQVWRGQFHNRRKDGTLYWEQMSISPVYDAEGRMTHFIAVREDVTAQKEVEAALRSYAERLQVLHELDGYLLTMRSPEKMASAASARLKRLLPCERIYVLERRPDGDVILVAAESSHGLPLPMETDCYEEIMQSSNLWEGRPMGCPDLRALSERDAFQQYLYEVGVLAYVVVPLITRNELVGTLHLESIHADVFTQEHVTIAGETAALLAVAVRQARLYALAQQEIAERREAEARLREYTRDLEASNAELDAFAHTVAHDLKSPLSTLVGFSEFLLESHADLSPERLEEELGYMVRSGWRMTNIVDELLLLASVRRQEQVELAPLDTPTLIEEARRRLRGIIEEYGAILELPERWPVAQGYAPWVEEIWVNYLSNAVKYGGDPPVIRLGAERVDQSRVRFWVQDNGRGLTPEEQQALFTEFTRLDALRTKGYGLGLSIVRRIVERLGGEAGVESVPGEGSRFYFTLPAVDAEKASPASQAAETDGEGR